MIVQIRGQECPVIIRHIRSLKKGYYNPSVGAVDNYLTRGEFERYSAGQDKFGDVVKSTGGFTECHVKVGDEIHTFKRNFGKMEPFNRKLGVRAVLGKAQKVLN